MSSAETPASETSEPAPTNNIALNAVAEDFAWMESLLRQRLLTRAHQVDQLNVLIAQQQAQIDALIGPKP